jgi:glutathione peroxidase
VRPLPARGKEAALGPGLALARAARHDVHMRFHLHLVTVLLGGLCGASPAVQAAETPAGCPALLQHTFPRLQDEKPQLLCQYSGKVALVVNTASYCGFTPQYKGLEALYDKYKDKGLVVLGFPSNDFSQESGSNQQIADFCENTFGVKFPMFAKTQVTGRQAVPFYQQLAAAAGQQRPLWNFHKYLLSRDGKVVGSYPSQVAPQDPRLIQEIEKQLMTR